MSRPYRPIKTSTVSRRPRSISLKLPWMRGCLVEEVHIDNLDTESWTEQELELLRSLVTLKIPIDIISSELERSHTATALEAIDLRLSLFSWTYRPADDN